LIPADEFNPEGYLEHRPTVYLNTILQLGEHLRPAELFENLAIARGRRIINRLTKIRYLLPRVRTWCVSVRGVTAWRSGRSRVTSQAMS
jgi:hypothetical protein